MGCGASKSFPTMKQGNSSGSIEIRIVLIGKTGAGKSTLGNAILGKPAFDTESHSMASTTVSCQTEKAVIGNMNIFILDTPGVMGTNQNEEQIMKEIFKGTSSFGPGPHVFLLVIRADAKFTNEEIEAVEIFSKHFGEAMYKHLIIVFTHKSAFDKSNKIEEYCLRKLPETFQQFKECCITIETGGKIKQVKTEVTKLLQAVVEKVTKKNSGEYYPGEKIKEMEEKYMASIDAKQGFKGKGKEEFQKMAGVAYDKVADTVTDVKEIVEEKLGALYEGVKRVLKK